MKVTQKACFIALFIVLLCSSSCYGNCSRKLSKHARRHKIRPANPNTQRKFSGGGLVLNVDQFGAKADGRTDNYQAFMTAWNKACNSPQPRVILVPKQKIYYVSQINFTGPCKAPLTMEIQGKIKAFPQVTFKKTGQRLWIKFQNLSNLQVQGGGTIDGNGQIWWDNTCKIKKSQPCNDQNSPTAMTFSHCTNLQVTNIRVKDPQQMHMNFQDCSNVKASNLMIKAPETSPNTDGIHITRTQKIDIFNSIIQTGDDCISIVNGSSDVRAMNIACGPGHGISIGSLGEDNSANYVSNVLVNGAKLQGTTNGVRIKTWQGGSGYAKDIVFQNIQMKNVSNPIIIDQNYCDEKQCHQQASAVKIENVMYKNIRGTSASEVAINFNCSKTFPCDQLKLIDVNLSLESGEGKAKATCSNLRLDNVGTSNYPLCSAGN